MRINRYLAQCNLGSRRSVEQYIKQGRIRVNDVICTNLSETIDIDKDIVLFDEKHILPIAEKIYIALNKPRGYVVTKNDELGRKTIYKLLPEEWSHLFPIGRLDKDTEGLMLMTNDGDFANKILHPRHLLPKIYRVTVKGRVNRADIDSLRDGIVIDGEKTLPARVFIKKNDKEMTELRITLYQGRNRQIRKMIESLGYSVILLKRMQVANIKLDKLPIGMFRLLKPSEVVSIMFTKDI